MNIKQQPVRWEHRTPKRVLKGEEAKKWRYKKWFKYYSKSIEDKVQNRLWILGHTFDKQPKTTLKDMELGLV